MAEKPTILGSFEEFVLLAIVGLGGEAYGVPIRHAVEEAVGKNISVGALYTTLERLADKGYVRSWQGDPSEQRGGRTRTYFRVEPSGLAALKESSRIRSRFQVTLNAIGA